MNTLYGTPRQNDEAFDSRSARAPLPVVYARAALFLPDETERRTLSGDLLVEAARRMKRGDEPLDIVLVTDDAASGLLTRLPMGLALAGVVAEREGRSELPNGKIAVVWGVPGIDTAIKEGDLLIVDAEKSRVLVEPDAEEFVRLQTERHRARVLLGAAHTPAYTQAGRVIPVWASVSHSRDVSDALSSGADGIVLEVGGDLLGGLSEPERNPLSDPDFPDPDDETEAMSLLTVVEAVGGGPIGLNVPFGVLDPALILSLGRVCELRWAVFPDELPLPLPELKSELAALAEGDENAPEGVVPLFAALPQNLNTDDLAETLAPFDEVWMAPDALLDLTLGDVYGLPTVRVLLGNALDVLPDAVALGVHGVVVSPALVELAKDIIRQQPN